jgi:GTPase involved in cell partitioning and DNA repair
MLSIVLNIIGIILVLYSVYVINKDISKKKVLVDDLNLIEERVKEYYKLTENIVEDFDGIMESKLEIIDRNKAAENNEQLIPENIMEKFIVNDNRKINDKESSNSIYEKIIELKTIGLTNEEIAKKLNKGIREVEIVFKMYNNRN